MITRTVTVREGERVGDIDWSYDFASHDWDHGGACNPVCIADSVEKLRQLASGGDWEATTDGGWPRVGWHRVLDLGMYDGWPYWRPVPSVLMEGMFSPQWHSFCSITDIARTRT